MSLLRSDDLGRTVEYPYFGSPTFRLWFTARISMWAFAFAAFVTFAAVQGLVVPWVFFVGAPVPASMAKSIYVILSSLTLAVVAARIVGPHVSRRLPIPYWIGVLRHEAAAPTLKTGTATRTVTRTIPPHLTDPAVSDPPTTHLRTVGDDLL